MDRKKRNSAAQSFLAMQAKSSISAFGGNGGGGMSGKEMSDIGGRQEKNDTGLQRRVTMLESRLFRAESENEQLKNKNQKLENAQVRNQELEATQGKLQTRIRELETAQSKLETRLTALKSHPATVVAAPVAIQDKTAESKDKIDSSSPTRALQPGLFFRRLPPEIREMIWRLSLPGPRAVRARLSSKDSRYYISSAPIPALLHLCDESRQYALKIFSIVGQSWDKLGGFYYDRTSDFLHTSCSTCHNPNWVFDGPKRLQPPCGLCDRRNVRAENLLFEWASTEPWTPFSTALLFHSNVKVLWIVTPLSGLLPHSLPLSSFVDSSRRYHWQKEESLALDFKGFVEMTEKDIRETWDQGRKVAVVRHVEYIGEGSS